MPEGLPTREELTIAWRRVKLDRPKRCFVTHPYLFDWIESALDQWLDSVHAQLVSGYVPHEMKTCFVPKAGWMIRPGAVLDLRDEVVYNALIGRAHQSIWQTIGWAQADPDVAYQLLEPSDDHNWIRSGFPTWREWSSRSKEKITSGISNVAFLDIAGFYDNIDLSLLRSDLIDSGAESVTVGLLMDCLNRWAERRKRGIPQGYSGSDILAKLYLHTVDQALRNDGFIHLRYVDDVRIFCESSLQAKRALFQISRLLGDNGLSLQTAKTEILPKEDALVRIDGVLPTIRGIQTQLGEELSRLVGYDGEYATLDDLERGLEIEGDGPPREVLERCFEDRFLRTPDSKFNRTLFHYLLTRLAKCSSPIAVDYSVRILQLLPDETAPILRYLREINVSLDQSGPIIDYCGSNDAIYDYQLFQFARWYFERGQYPEGLISLCRTWASDRNRDPWLRSYARAILGVAGNTADVEALLASYSDTEDEMERAEIAMSVQRLERSRRNSFYRRIQNDGFLVERAIESARRA